MILINSADYVNSEFQNEFGAIPPCFLPLGNKKLLVYQINCIRENFPDECEIMLSLPEKYELNISEQILIDSLSIQVIFVPERISLGMAILYVLNSVENNNGILRLLHGDTLLYHFPKDKDCIGLVPPQDDYSWQVENIEHENLIWCGYFSFSSQKNFIKALAKTQGDFVNSVNIYAKNEPKLNYIKIKDWYDLGHINTYFSSRAMITTQRAFNSLRIVDNIVWKSGSPPQKIEAEVNWFFNLPKELKRFIPQLLSHGKLNEIPFYETEYLPYLPLNELFVHGKNPILFWKKILNKIDEYLEISRKCFYSNIPEIESKIVQDSIALYREKTYERLESYSKTCGIDLDKPTKYDKKELPSIRKIAETCITKTLSLPTVFSISHGDLCFSNILYDSRGGKIKVLDPRGMNIDKEFTLYGNQTYDLAKLCHSFIGLYDFIIADAFILNENNEIGIKLEFNIDSRLCDIQELFMNKSLLPSINNIEIISPTILLFLSMIPLHFDKPNRQKAMLANALRLYKEYFTG